MPEFIDRQLNTPYATGSIWYAGAFNPRRAERDGLSSCRWCPNGYYNLGIADARRGVQDKYHKTFAELSSEQQDEALGLWESGKAEFKRPRCSSPICLQNTAKGFFSDPIRKRQ